MHTGARSRLALAGSISVASFVSVSCSPGSREVEPPLETVPVTQALISDQKHEAGAQGFFWLHPLVDRHAPEGALDRTLSPQVDIDEIDSNQQVVRHLATFTRKAGTGKEIIEVTRKHYQVDWKTKKFAVKPGHVYRIRVSVAGRELGIADVKVVKDCRKKNQVDDDKYVPLVAGETLPIRFFLNRCAPVLCQAADSCHQAGVCDPARTSRPGRAPVASPEA